ncbi:hypothetical protein M9Y10_020178 [Tritrichomonas musculus]|uniref:Proliferating cell nuclear antigen PCNA N-terminal domain-containing protein n=1 Tax=Tritrichomonas musculus TaxID=1915356 RepID=A0ABR2GKY2_9EUKA
MLFNIDIPWKCEFVKYYVSSINTKVNILMTTEDDYLIFETANKEIRIDFEEAYNYSFNYLVKFLNTCQKIIEFKNINNRTISLTSTENIIFKEGSHRAKLITGFFNCSYFEVNANEEKKVPDLPILDFANKLYLVSLQGVATHSAIGDKEYTPSIIANIDTMILDQEALIVNYDITKPIKIKVNTDSLKYLEMRLVDFMFQPVILKSPLFITLKIKPSTNADIYDILTK